MKKTQVKYLPINIITLIEQVKDLHKKNNKKIPVSSEAIGILYKHLLYLHKGLKDKEKRVKVLLVDLKKDLYPYSSQTIERAMLFLKDCRAISYTRQIEKKRVVFNISINDKHDLYRKEKECRLYRTYNTGIIDFLKRELAVTKFKINVVNLCFVLS